MKTKTPALLALLLLPLAAHATQADRNAILHSLANASTKLASKVAPVLADQQADIDKKCPLGKLTPDTVSVINDVAFNLDGIPERGDWMVRYTATACGHEVLRTASFHGNPKGVEVTPAAPGNTLADASLGKDVWTSFQKAANRAAPSCRQMTLLDTQITEAPASSSTYWREAWIGRVCGRQMGQIVSFYPSAAGTMFRMALPSEPSAEKQIAPAYNPPK